MSKIFIGRLRRPVGFFRYIFALIVIPRVKGCWGRRGGQENFEFFMGFWSKIGRGPGHVAEFDGFDGGPGHVAEFDDLTDLTEFDGGPAQN